jgi:hypothetical protein
MNFNKKMISYILLSFIVLFTASCQKDAKNPKNNMIKKENKKNELIKKKNLRILKTGDNFIGTINNYDSLEIKIPDDFKKKKDYIFFQENGINLSLGKDFIKSTTNIDDYIKENYDALKNDFSNTIKEEEEVLINNHIVKYIKYIIDRKKYLIQVETILLRSGNSIYTVVISGKKKHIDLLSEKINDIFSTIKIKETL